MIQSEEFYQRLCDYMRIAYDKTPEEAEKHEFYQAFSRCLQEIIPYSSLEKETGKQKQTFLLSAEYSPGSPLRTALTELELSSMAEEVAIRAGWELADLADMDEVKLGCSGKGMFASSLMESAATCDVPLTGYGLRYQYGYFRQKLVNGFQQELGDDWTRFGDPWSLRKENEAIEVHLGNQTVLAVPYDMIQYGFRGKGAARLRLWKCESPDAFNWELFQNGKHDLASEKKRSAEDVTRLLYPTTDTPEGQKLFMTQAYFLASASMRDLLEQYVKSYGNDFTHLDQFCSIHINDMFPALAIPELIRLLMRHHDMEFVPAFYLAKNIFSYTNYAEIQKNILSCPLNLLNEIAPDVCYIILMINEHLVRELSSRQLDIAHIRDMKIVTPDHHIDFLKLLIYSCSHISGLSLEPWRGNDALPLGDWAALYPKRFYSVRGGVSPRRWLLLANPSLSKFLTDELQTKRWITHASTIRSLAPKLDDTPTIEQFNEAKKSAKVLLANHLWENRNLHINPDTFISVHVRHISEVQRQLLGAFGMLSIYYGIKDGRIKNFTPTTYLIGGKALPRNWYGKTVIKYICEVSSLLQNDPDTRDLLSLVFLENTGLSLRQYMVPAADLSLQLSSTMPQATAISNLQFLINGTVSLGTEGGSAAAFRDEKILKNNFIFGKTDAEHYKEKDFYDPRSCYEQNTDIARVINSLTDGTFSDGGMGKFNELRSSLLDGSSGKTPDPYFILHDLPLFVEQFLLANRSFQNPQEFGRRGMENLLYASDYSTDRTIHEYSQEIWKTYKPPLKISEKDS